MDAFQHDCQVTMDLNWIMNLILDTGYYSFIIASAKERSNAYRTSPQSCAAWAARQTYALLFVLGAVRGLSGIGPTGRAGVVSLAAVFTKPEGLLYHQCHQY